MSGNGNDQVLIDDSITADEAGFSSDVGSQKPQEGQESSQQSEQSGEGDIQDQVEEALANGATEKQVQSMIEEFVLKVNGKEVKRKVDLSDKEYIKKELQMAAAGREAMQRSKELEKVFEQELMRLRDNPWEVLKEMGHNPEKLAEDLLRKQVDEYKKPPEQKKQEELQRQLEAARKEASNLKKEAEDAKRAQYTKEASMRLNKEIVDALDAHKTLPKNERTVARIAEALDWAVDNGYDDVEISDVIPAIEAQIKEEIRQLLSEAPAHLFEEYVGKQTLDRYRNERLASVKKAPKNQEVRPTASSVESKKSSAKQKQSAKDFFRNLR
jgi:hypothetical protein